MYRFNYHKPDDMDAAQQLMAAVSYTHLTLPTKA